MEVKYEYTSKPGGYVEINNLEDLQEFRKTIGKGKEIILSEYRESEGDMFEIEVYDTYRE